MKICKYCNEQKEESEIHKGFVCKFCLYKRQMISWQNKKEKAVKEMGGCCSICGYNKNHAALSFHHLDPSIKSYSWNKLRLRPWNSILNELKKCILVCANCHMEIHHPNRKC